MFKAHDCGKIGLCKMLKFLQVKPICQIQHLFIAQVKSLGGRSSCLSNLVFVTVDKLGYSFLVSFGLQRLSCSSYTHLAFKGLVWIISDESKIQTSASNTLNSYFYFPY